MTAEKFKRKLTAILSADVKGYSRLMGEDEESTLRILQEYKEVMASSIQHHRGRIVGSAGDNLLAEFASVVDAVQCAVEIQQVLRAKNALLPEDRRMDFRIGINLGDVIEEGDTIYGDGVNIAARLESMAEAGGICISESAYQQIKNKLPLKYDYLGEHEVKNIAEPVRVYRAQIEPEATSSKIIKEKKPVQKGLSKAAMAILAVLVIAGVAILYQFILRPSPSKIDIASKEKMAFPLPDVPSIAVLPFVNMSKDPDQEFLCDGMTEAIITALSKVPNMFVIARNSTFVYKGKPVKIKQVSEELGVRYVLEGSLQRSGDRVRITAQLIDALTGHHLWAESYDRDLKDIFALQDSITLKILTGVQVKFSGGDVAMAEKYAEKYYKGKQGLDCYLQLIQANDRYNRWNITDNNLARRKVEEAIAMCPENPIGYIQLAWVYLQDTWLGNTKSPRENIEKAIDLGQKVLAMDDLFSGAGAHAHAVLSAAYRSKDEVVTAKTEAERAVALAPTLLSALNNYGWSLNNAGRPDEAIQVLEKAIRLNPIGLSFLYESLGTSLRNAGRFDEAVSALKKAIKINPDYLSYHARLAGIYVMMGREQEARVEAAEILRINPKFSEDFVAKNPQYKDQSETDKVDSVLRHIGAIAFTDYAVNLMYSGRSDKAIPFFQKAIQLNPSDSSIYDNFGIALRNAGRFDEAVSALKKAIQLMPNSLGAHSALAVTYIMMGREQEARAEAAEVFRINPKFSVDSWAKTFIYKDQSQQDKIVNAMRKAAQK